MQLYVGGINSSVTEDDIWQTFAGCPVHKVRRFKEAYCFVHLPDINTALDVMRDKDNAQCGSRHIRISLSTPTCKHYGVSSQPHRKPQLLLAGMPADANVEDVRDFLGEFSGSTEDITPAKGGEWSVVCAGVNEALAAQEALDQKPFLGNSVEVRLSDASSRCLSVPTHLHH